MKAKKYTDALFICILSILTVTLGSLVLLLPKEDISKKERRALAQFPPLSAEAIISGNFWTDIGDFYSDQFPLRDSFTSVYAFCELSLGRREVNEIICSSGRLFKKPNTSDARTDKLSNNLKRLAKYENLRLYLVPSPARSYLNLPQVTVANNDDRIISPNVLLNNGELFYSTDHHWTTKGAYLAYRDIAAALSLTPYEENFFKLEKVCDDFYGTAYARSCLPSLALKPDSIVLYRYDGDSNVQITNSVSGRSRKGFYYPEALRGADKYAVFLGGNYARVSIKGVTPKPRLVLIKDSFANSVLPFLALHFDIEMIDPRFVTRAELYDALEQSNAEAVLVLLSEETLASI